jgi:hypothetical protein
VAVNELPVWAGTSAEPGETETEIGSAEAIMMVAAADRVVSATEIAVRITDAFAGTAEGGV